MNLKNRHCPICNSQENVFLYEQKFSDNTIYPTTGYNVVVCKECGFTYADNIPSQTKFDDYYTAMSKYEFNHQSGAVSDEYMANFTKIFNFLAPRLKDKKARILDIGCSTGGLLSIFKLRGYTNIFGIDPSPECSRFAKDQYDIFVATNTIYDFNPKEKFDLIILSAVLEHLVDFDYSMKKIRSLLNEDGLLFISVPDVERFSSYISTPFQQFSTEHINYFSRYSIVNLLSQFSFIEIESRQDEHKINQITDPEIMSLSQKKFGSELKIIRDNISELCIKEYVEKCRIIDVGLQQNIRAKLLDKDKIIVWGVGTHTQRLIDNGLDSSKILYFVDSNKRYIDKKMSGLEIKQPNEIKEDYPILISTYAYQEEITHQIRDILKLNNEIITLYK